MRVGDAAAEVWLEGIGGRTWCLTVMSQREGQYGSKRWQRPTFEWAVERHQDDPDSDESFSGAVAQGRQPTYAAAFRLAMRAAVWDARRYRLRR